ncbi:MAG: cysteine--tRNA ligase [Thermoleophilia bacterium]|nr:cysteine--tRNA ligase [Thermoleophilia bacterium]
MSRQNDVNLQQITVYNSLTRKKEDFIPRDRGKVGIYVCGPTVYGYVHVGNARPYVFFAVLSRYLRHLGYEVTLVENLTDVDDKIIERASKEGTTSDEIAKQYSDAYIEDTGRLGLERPDVEPKATEHIEEIIDICKDLVEAGYAYETGGSLYFRVGDFTGYGKLSGQKTDQMLHCELPRDGEAKESPLDFAIWKAAKPGEPSWESPWGQGRPGWHIECTAMSLKYLGKKFDIHGGGLDLVFPHHENEVAQAEAVTGTGFVRYWMHNGMITRKDEKMSKSIGNIFLLREFLKNYDPRVLILFFMGSHYRSPLEFSERNLDEAATQLERFRNCLWKINGVVGETGPEIPMPEADAGTGHKAPDAGVLQATIERTREQFDDEMRDDINTAGALAAVFGLVRVVNEYTEAASVAGGADAGLLVEARELLVELLHILGVDIAASEYGESGFDQELLDLVKAREQARLAKDYAAADAARDRLAEAGYEVRDTPQGPKLVKKV